MDTFWNHDFARITRIYIAQEYVEDSKNEVTTKLRFYQISHSIVHLHAGNICHRDLKLKTLLLVSNSWDSFLNIYRTMRILTYADMLKFCACLIFKYHFYFIKHVLHYWRSVRNWPRWKYFRWNDINSTSCFVRNSREYIP